MRQTKPMGDSSPAPSWDALYALAAAQAGCFTREQAREAGFSDQLLYKHVGANNLERVQRGIYRITRFPESGREQEDLVIAWLWSEAAGVLSHETALRLHGLSDTLPSNVHLTLPSAWRGRGLRPPAGVQLSFGEVPAHERAFIGAVPVTRPARTINDVATAHGDVDVVRVALRQAIQRGLADPVELLPAVDYLSDAMPPAWPVRPEAVAELGGSWLGEVVAGRCRAAPPSDWRVAAEALAAAVGGRLRAARYFRGTRTMSIELVWPVADRDQKPGHAELRAQAALALGWES
jgi:predicted transcriptional regulator of viral defense system